MLGAVDEIKWAPYQVIASTINHCKREACRSVGRGEVDHCWRQAVDEEHVAGRSPWITWPGNTMGRRNPFGLGRLDGMARLPELRLRLDAVASALGM